MSPPPYVGITDFTSFAQVQNMARVFRECRPPASNRVLHVGVMMNYKTLNDIPTSWSTVFPSNETIVDIFRPIDELVRYYLHYADYDDQTSAEDLAEAIGYGGPHIHGVQLDMTWPDPRMIEAAIRAPGKQIEVVLQVGEVAMKEVGNTPSAVVRRLEEYRGLIHRVLLDKSAGRGRGMDAEAMLPFLLAIQECFPELGLVGAGGLGPKTMHLVRPLVQVFPGLSIDAQGRLRPSGSARDSIDWAMAEEYLRQAFPVFYAALYA